ncbi:MAG: hypothetical protein CL844_05620 [Crocinitomicaceae bacterium]|nr:hypothetical protein [Crocinitomicaceae bacterium]
MTQLTRLLLTYQLQGGEHPGARVALGLEGLCVPRAAERPRRRGDHGALVARVGQREAVDLRRAELLRDVDDDDVAAVQAGAHAQHARARVVRPPGQVLLQLVDRAADLRGLQQIQPHYTVVVGNG